MKNTKKWISVLLCAMLLITTLVASGVSASAASGTLTSYYKTNPNGQVGVQKTISIDGDLSDWSSAMLIAQGTANDDPRVYRENSMHELPVDLYALYGAYDDNNLYLMWEMTNVGDVVCPEQGYVISQGILWQTQELPFFIVIDTGKSADAVGNQGSSRPAEPFGLRVSPSATALTESSPSTPRRRTDRSFTAATPRV